MPLRPPPRCLRALVLPSEDGSTVRPSLKQIVSPLATVDRGLQATLSVLHSPPGAGERALECLSDRYQGASFFLLVTLEPRVE